ncbi:hypothetical protein [Pseudohongiella sp. O18]|uniref:hypothetical protein n=1 Tax=Pseudohongiella sp. O18 TaxID=2904248 RepID=UPI000C68E2AB|nr:hypothetical protein [Pseudohongiella sp. O18]MAY54325.1 hypothetical protein [Gammaproteobacteria bacterium]MBJ56007.1 hypothetical protein [Gammaproteobacteria bacterium]HBN15178.1 hypothetical protein [Pseudohongiella sp.]|tara:strand:- start:102 stop:344 length:243 start_codon:yes stop_codon:yes gene_type:complete
MGKRRVSVKTRATLGGLAIAVAALYALTVSYDIPLSELASFLIGSLAVVIGTMLLAVLVVAAIKLMARLIRKIGERKADD